MEVVELAAAGPGLGYKGPGSDSKWKHFNIEDIGEGTVDSDDLSFGLSLKEGLFGLGRLYNSIPTPLNLAKKAANKFKNYRADKKAEKAQALLIQQEAAQAAKQTSLEALKAMQLRDQRNK